MKPTLYIISALLAVSPTLHARIDETIDQIEKRYGHSIKAEKSGAIESRQYAYLGFNIFVTFENGASKSEMYQKEGVSPISEKEIATLLNANSGGMRWRSEPAREGRTEVYRSADGRSRVALYNATSRHLMITSQDFLERFTDAHQAKLKSGF